MKSFHESKVATADGQRYMPVAICLLLPFLCACGAESRSESAREIVATVNGDAITARELGDRSAMIGLRATTDIRIGEKQVLESLVDEKLLAQKAIETGLDRKPETRAALERARQQVLAQATVDHTAGNGPVTYRDTKAFYDGHPELFARRRSYIFRRFELLVGELRPSLRAELDRAESPAEVGFLLKRAGEAFGEETQARAAETLPPDFLKHADVMQRGDIVISREDGRIVLMQLVSSIAEPVGLVRATPAIRAFLLESRRKSAASQLLQNLRTGAKIEYSRGLIDDAKIQAAAEGAGPQEAQFQTRVAGASAVNGPR
jgi:peptidyl-prolyl cis-trans isomerase C